MSIASDSTGPVGKSLLFLERLTPKRFELVGLAILAAALLVRIVVALLFSDINPHTAQIWEYGDIARTSIQNHNIFVRSMQVFSVQVVAPTAYVPPLPVFIWEGLFTLFGVSKLALAAYMVLNVLGSILIVWQTRFFATLAGLSRIAILAATGIMAFYPTFVYSAALYHELNLYIPLLLGACIVAYQLAVQPSLRLALLLGVVGGLTVLVRTEYIVLLAGVYIGSWFVHRSWKFLIVSVAASFLIVVPWTIRNAVVFHRFIPVADTMGYSLWKGFNPETQGSSGDEEIVQLWGIHQSEPELRKLKASPNIEIDIDDAYGKIAVQFIKQHPLQIIPLSIQKLALFWGFDWLDPSITFRPAYLGSVIPVSLLAFWGIFLALRRPSSFDKIAFGLFLGQSLAIVVYSVQARYRMNIEPMLAIYAGLAIATILTHSVSRTTAVRGLSGPN